MFLADVPVSAKTPWTTRISAAIPTTALALLRRPADRAAERASFLKVPSPFS
jgi:hypothetical protein